MDSQQAKEILLLHRPGIDREADPELEAVLEQVKRDPELARWCEQHRAVQSAIRLKFREIPLPPSLLEKILAENQVHRLALWRRPAFLAAAAAIGLLIALASLWFPREADSFAAYRDRMVRTALRDYRMNIVTNDLSQIRDYLERHQAHGDYVLTRGLKKLPGEGCAILSWRGKRVSLICFNSLKRVDLFLFIINRSALPDGPSSAQPRFRKVNKLMTASWSLGDKIYLLAGPGDEEFLRKHL